MMRTLALIVATGCAVHAAPLPPDHPASAAAPVGRLAGAPASLRPGSVGYGDGSAEPAQAPEPAAPAHVHPAPTPTTPTAPTAPPHHHH